MQSSLYRFKEFIHNSYEELSEGELKFANLILNNFEEVEKIGTAAGKRAKYISSIYDKIAWPPATKETAFEDNQNNNIQRLSSIDIQGFRGFVNNETFDLSKKYNFLYGPNGTGKSSFCEALEFSLTGKINEAESKGFKIKPYIKNMYCKSSAVTLKVINPQGDVVDLTEPKSGHEFMFIERNRIEGFARVSSYTASAQQQRLSLLFGLETFNNFCNGFSDSIINYIDLKTPVLDKYKETVLKIAQAQQAISRKEQEQQELNNKKIGLLSGYPMCELASDLIAYLSPDNGLIKEKQDSIYKYNNIKLHNVKPLESLLTELTNIDNDLLNYERTRNDIENSSSKVEFLNLYTAIKTIASSKDTEHDCCPACDTPLHQVKNDPFLKSIKQLVLLKELSEKQSLMLSLRKRIESACNVSNQKLLNHNIQSTIDYDLTDTEQGIVFQNTQTSLKNTKLLVQKKIEELENQNLINKPLVDSVSAMTLELKKLNHDLGVANQLSALFKLHIKDIKDIREQIVVIEKEKSMLENKLQLEEKRLAKNSTFIADYCTFIGKLKKYNLELPSVLSESLSERVLKIYNLINNHPYDHEILKSLSLPRNSSEKINIEFYDGNKDDALRILSEGHLRCLGLSILLAKNIHDGHNLIVFDDVVNAIDDEHRSGVLEAIFSDPDLSQKQLVITTHGEDFLKRLENRIPSKDVKVKLNRYDFKRNLDQRTILISSNDFRQYIVKAQLALMEGKTKDALMESRRSLEGLTNELWKHIGKQRLDSSVSVQLRQPGGSPDLYGIVSGLIKSLKEFEKKPGFFGYVPIKQILMDIQGISQKHNVTWKLLNKGTHEEDRNEEFDEHQAAALLKQLEALESEILDYKKPTPVVS
ncbi:hypothetical protein AB4395_01715 [Vibrio splendidus]